MRETIEGKVVGKQSINDIRVYKENCHLGLNNWTIMAKHCLIDMLSNTVCENKYFLVMFSSDKQDCIAMIS